MRKTAILCWLLALFYFGPVSLPFAEESISGRNFRAAQAAVAELARKNLDISLYRIIVRQRGSSFFVTFIDVDAPDDPQIRGNPGSIPAFEVELARNDLRVIRSNFVR